MPTKEELEILKLEEELKQLKAPFWRKPSYLTIIVSALTIVISAALGFSTYYTKVDEKNVEQIKELESKIRESKAAELAAKDQLSRLESETYKLRYEDFKNKVDDKKNELTATKNELIESQRRLDNYKIRFNEVSSQVENYISEEYTPGFANGILNNKKNELEMKKYVSNNNELNELKKFIYWVVSETYKKTNEKRKLELSQKLKEI